MMEQPVIQAVPSGRDPHSQQQQLDSQGLEHHIQSLPNLLERICPSGGSCFVFDDDLGQVFGFTTKELSSEVLE